ncbi:type VII secretion integral membrane protein EccD [Schaalia suimastitidis]|uniref:type VII secretion integral membrane protein EccD n=1 Tax=Schaalia suimastitidis TaxID=121163 RepID=UPI00042A1BE2|nr:type VII secretion integral membrane protein EccD [Schaalia suimastitidis]
MLSSTSRNTALLPLTVSLNTQSADVTVPATIALAELLPALVSRLAPLDAQNASLGFSVSTASGRRLDLTKSLREQTVRPGSVLTLHPHGTTAEEQRYDDLVEAVSTIAERDQQPWEAQHSLQLSAHAAALLILVAAALLTLDQTMSVISAGVGIVGAILTTLAAMVVNKSGSTPGALSLVHTVPVILGAAAFALTPGGWVGMPLLAAGSAIAASATVLLVLPRRNWPSAVGPLTVGLAYLLTGILTFVFDVPTTRAVALSCALLAIISLGAPWVAMAAFPTTVGTNRDLEQIDPTVVGAVVEGGHIFTIALKAGATLALVTFAPALATSTLGMALLGAIGVALMLTTRALRSRVEVVIGVIGGMALSLIAVVAAPTVAPWTLPWVIGGMLTAAILLLGINVITPKLRPWLTRCADALTSAALISIIPLTVLLWGVF